MCIKQEKFLARADYAMETKMYINYSQIGTHPVTPFSFKNSIMTNASLSGLFKSKIL